MNVTSEELQPKQRPPSSQKVLAAQEVIFIDLAWKARTDEDDKKLYRRAIEISGFVRDTTIDSVMLAEADEAAHLMSMLPDFEMPHHDLTETRKYLMSCVFYGLRDTCENMRIEIYAKALLKLPALDNEKHKELRDSVEGMLRHMLGHEFHVGKLARILKHATPLSNESVVRKSWQTICAQMQFGELVALGHKLAKED